MNPSTTSNQIGLLVDGTTLHAVALDVVGEEQLLKVKVHLTQGKHILIFTTPMPLTDAEAQAVPKGDSDNWVGMNAAYPWFDMNAISLGKGLTITDEIKQFYSDGIEHCI